MEIWKAPTMLPQALNKRSIAHIMYVEIKTVTNLANS